MNSSGKIFLQIKNNIKSNFEVKRNIQKYNSTKKRKG